MSQTTGLRSMEGFNFTNASQDNISDHDNIYFILPGMKVMTCIIISIGFSLIPVAIYAVCSLVCTLWPALNLLTACVMCLLCSLSVKGLDLQEKISS